MHHWLVSRRGGERVLHALAALTPGAPLYTLVHDPHRSPAPIDVSRVVTSPLARLPFARQTFRAWLPCMHHAYRHFDLAGHELVISSDACLAKTVRVPPGAIHVCYCYSPVRYAWQLETTYLQRAVPWLLRPLARAVMKCVRRTDYLAAQQVDHFIAISQTVARRIERCYGRTPLAVVPPPVDTEFFRPDLAPRPEVDADHRPYLLLGANVPYKRTEDGVEACRRLDRALIVAGSNRGRRRLQRLAGPRTRFVDDPDDETVRDLYRSCRALLFPGEEDFGLVPVEAMACGRPVVALGRGGASETVVDGHTGVLYPTPGVEALLEALQRFEQIEARLDPEQAVARASRFSRAAFDQRMRAVLEDVADRIPSRVPGEPLA